MKIWVGLIALSLSIPALSEPVTRNQSHALVDGVKEATRALLISCTHSEDFVRCAETSGIHCENIAEKSVLDYRCVSRATLEFTIDKSAPPALSEIWEVAFLAFYADERWNVGPESISRAVD